MNDNETERNRNCEEGELRWLPLHFLINACLFYHHIFSAACNHLLMCSVVTPILIMAIIFLYIFILKHQFQYLQFHFVTYGRVVLVLVINHLTVAKHILPV